MSKDFIIEFIVGYLIPFVLILFLTIYFISGLENSEYEVKEVKSIREYYGNFGKKKVIVKLEDTEICFDIFDIKIGEETFFKDYVNLFNKDELYLSESDYEMFVGSCKYYGEAN